MWLSFCPMLTVTEQQAKAQLSRLLERARDGEEIIVTRDGKPYAKVIPLDKDYPEPTNSG